MSYDYEKKWPGLDIKYLILSTDEFIVFIDSSIDVDWATVTAHEPKDVTAHNNILNKVALLEGMPSAHLSEKIRLIYKRMIGEAIARSLDHDYINADKMLSTAEKYVAARNAEIARSWYLSSSGATSCLLFLMGVGFWLLRDWTRPLLGELVFVLVLSSIAGSLGALLSVIMRMGSANVDALAGKNVHYMEGAFRIVAGTISALIVALGVYSGVLLPIFSQINKQHVAMILAGLIAGASERLVTSFIAKVNSESNEGAKRDNPQ